MASRALEKTVYQGTFVHSKNLTELEVLHAVFVDEDGKIVAVERDASEHAVRDVLARLAWSAEQVPVRRSGREQFFFPGFIDTHIHASQYPNAGIFGKSTLLDWLETYTFPMEASMSSLPRAQQVYARCVARTLSHGTTTAAYFATRDVASTNLLADLCLAAGQRAFIGRVCMDTELQPAYYRDESVEAALAATVATVEHVQAIDARGQLISPIVTPRFAPSCTSSMLRGLGALARERDLPVQTHLSENENEIALVRTMFPEQDSYTDVYEKHGLLGPRTILAHAVHLSEGERAVIARTEAKVSHCPASNSAITSGAARVRWLLEAGVDVGLGTDMSGGYSPSVLEAVRQALLVSRHVAMGGDDGAKLSVEECLHLATRGGAKVVGLPHRIGGFDVGMDFDAQLIGLAPVSALGDLDASSSSSSRDDGPVDVFGWESFDDKIAKWVFNGDDRNTLAVWVRGRLVHQRFPTSSV
ncbi:MAG: hypothetical protein M1818_000455 [Claussenomyces sp. TS43310]|nr:MAG: hypothetical protein M1818_000455 [Claussenomyces sp. TS43310]